MSIPFKGFVLSMQARSGNAPVRVHVYREWPESQHWMRAVCGSHDRIENIGLMPELKKLSVVCRRCAQLGAFNGCCECGHNKRDDMARCLNCIALGNYADSEQSNTCHGHTLYVTDVFKGKHVVCGGADGQLFIAAFADKGQALSFVAECRHSAFLIRGVSRTTASAQSQEKGNG